MSRNPKHNPRKIRAGLILSSVPVAVLRETEHIGRSLRFSKTVVMDETTLRFVPGSQLTVFVQDGLLDERQTDPIVAQIQSRTGTFTGHVRDVLILRRLDVRNATGYPTGDVALEYGPEMLTVLFAGVCMGKYSVFRAPVIDAIGVMLDTRKKYFQHLTEDEARGVAEIFAKRVTEGNLTLVAAYRLAGQMLYAYSRGRGWFKTDCRQRARWGTHLHWLKKEDIGFLREQWNRSGAGDYTLRSAEGG